MKLSELLSNVRIRTFLVAALLAVLATMLVNAYLKEEISLKTGGSFVNVVFIKNPIKQFDFIRPEDLKVGQFPSAFLDSRFIPADQIPNIQGLRVDADLKPNQILFWSDIVLTLRKSLSDHIGINERIITIPVNTTNSFNNMIEVGDRIDIICINRGSSLKASGETAEVILQDVFVIGVNNNLRRDVAGAIMPTIVDKNQQSNISTISLRVSPPDALRLAYAESVGKLTFVLRNRFDIFTSEFPTLGENQIQDTRTQFDIDRFGLPVKVKDYPVVYQQGKVSHSAYFPGQKEIDADLIQMLPAEFEQRLGDKVIQENVEMNQEVDIYQ